MNKANKFIDVHHHIIPEQYRSTLEYFGVGESGGMPIKKWTPETSLDMMDRLGIEVAIGSISEPGVIPILNPEVAKKLARDINEFQADMISKYPKRFGGFAFLPLPHVNNAIEELKYALDELKLDGVGLLSNYNEHFLGDPIFDDLMDELNKRNAVVFIHPSAPPASNPRPKFLTADFMAEFTFNTTRAAANLVLSGTIERCPNIKFILAHAGGTLPYLKWRIGQSYRAGKVWMKDSLVAERWSTLKKEPEEYMSNFYFETAISTQPATFEALKDTTSSSHILFGSDAHYAPEDWSKEMTERISNYQKFDDKLIEDILYNNALELFPRFKK
ncbi:amidohydrolase family protein [Clostridium massiliamazoniense]|uniref:amidohydrolase family protein n=1 Tax=Clostridium massiliamazoniense TaxID=1347366 RepID=UPI0006D79F84|nr:amidohydrolase family protein [Clostridium massiliamazoniense]